MVIVRYVLFLWWLGFSYVTLAQKQQVIVAAVNADTVLAVASHEYKTFPIFGALLMGSNYRKTWKTPVTLPVFYLSRSRFVIDRKGGSKQSNSLYLKDSLNRLWVLRSVDKQVERGIPRPFHITPFRWYKKSLVSGAHPYAALVASALCRSAGIIAPDPSYYFVAEDEALGDLNEIFANTVCMLEQRDPTPDGSATISTDTLLQLMERGAAYPVLQQQVLRARIIDMLLGDWDRHGGQWRWGILDSGGQKYYYAIPRDRDHSLFHIGGLLPTLMKVSFEPYLNGFKKSSSRLKKLNRKAWLFDRTFLSGLDRQQWETITKEVKSVITDEAISYAVQQLPAAIQALDGAFIEARLKSRRDSLEVHAARYYQFLFPKEK